MDIEIILNNAFKRKLLKIIFNERSSTKQALLVTSLLSWKQNGINVGNMN